MGFVHMRQAHDDVDLRLLDVVERLAAEFEGDVGVRPILDEVQRARDRLRLERLDEADHMDRVESIAHAALAELQADEGRPSATRLSGRATARRAGRYEPGGAAVVQYGLLVTLVTAVVAGSVAMIGLRVNVVFGQLVADVLSRVGVSALG